MSKLGEKEELDKKRSISLERAKRLKSRIEDYLHAREGIEKGLEIGEHLESRRQEIMRLFQATDEDWNSWHWQMKNRITDVKTLSSIVNLSAREKEEIQGIGQKFRWAISPYYASLMDPNNRYDPVRMQSIPSGVELTDVAGLSDPMSEEFTNPAGSITRRYPDRLIINVTNVCAMFCRHCQRRRNIDEVDRMQPWEKIQEAIDYVRQNEEVRDVLLTGGDPFTITDTGLEKILGALKDISHLEYIRFGTRTLVTMPQRITDNLCAILKRYHPLFVNTHFNHPKEITPAAKEACERLSNAGIPLGNQAVLLNGINNDRHVMKSLNHELLKVRVRPYYIFHAKAVDGTGHFRTSIDDGIEIMEYLRGYTSGLAIPQFIVNAPDGQGKTPVMPQYLLSRGKGYVVIRNWEGTMIKYPNQDTIDIHDVY